LDIWEIFANIFETKMIELQRLTLPAHGETKTRQICFENEKSRMNRLRKKRESMTQYPFKFYKPQIDTSLAAVDPKTFRKWSRPFVAALAKLQYSVVSQVHILW
jgi:hypothetical protein